MEWDGNEKVHELHVHFISLRLVGCLRTREWKNIILQSQRVEPIHQNCQQSLFSGWRSSAFAHTAHSIAVKRKSFVAFHSVAMKLHLFVGERREIVFIVFFRAFKSIFTFSIRIGFSSRDSRRLLASRLPSRKNIFTIFVCSIPFRSTLHWMPPAASSQPTTPSTSIYPIILPCHRRRLSAELKFLFCLMEWKNVIIFRTRFWISKHEHEANVEREREDIELWK